MTAPPTWDKVRPFIEGAFTPGRHVTRHDLLYNARTRAAPREVLEALQRVDFGMSFRDLEHLEAYLRRTQLVLFPVPE